MSNLFSDDEGDGGGTTMLTINEHYAKAFEYRKEREELEKLKAKYGSDYDPDASGSDFSTDSESAESEDEHGEELTPAVDAAILRTLARIRKKDPEIYDSSKSIFGEERERLAAKAPKISNGQTKSKSNSKPLTIRQVNLDAMLHPSRSPSPSAEEHQPLTHVQEQEALRRETIAAFHGAVADTGDDDFLIPREKTKDEREAEEEEYRAFLEREVGDLKELVTIDDERKRKNEDGEGGGEDEGEGEGGAAESDKKKKKKTSKKGKKVAPGGDGETHKVLAESKAEQDQEFLMNYILNRGWIDHSKGHVPTYNEVIEPVPERRKKKKKGKSKADDSAPNEGSAAGSDNTNNEDDDDDPALLTDSSFESIASIFEASYNHRFEEPGASTIPSFPRSLPSLARREDTTRKDARERRKARKEEEVRRKKEEVRRLKALKMREVRRKLERIGKEGGLKGRGGEEGEEGDGFVDEALRELDLEGEWDPEKHDRQMAGLFDRGAEAFEDDGDGDGTHFDDGDVDDDAVQYDADGKPVWEDDIGDIPISDDDGDVIYAPPPQSSKKEKKKKKKKKDDDDDDQGVDIDAMDADVKRAYDEEEEWDGTEEMRKRKLDEYMDEIYGLDFNDLVGGLPTRFKYVPVQKQTFALTPAEILLATDQELNEYLSVKKYAPYRLDKHDRSRWTKSAQEKLHELKAKVGERSGGVFGVGRGARGRREEGEGGEEKMKKRKGKKERMKAKAAVSAVASGGDGDSDDEKPTKSTPAPRPGEKRKRGDVDEQAERLSASAAAPGDEDATGDAGAGAAKKRKRRHHKKGDADAAQA